MDILQTKGKIKEGQLILDTSQSNVPTDTEAEVIILVKQQNNKESFLTVRQEMQQEMQKAFQEAGIESREQVL